MLNFTLHLGAPSHAVEPALLAQRLPTLAAMLQAFCAVDAVLNAPKAQASTVYVYAAQLGVQRDHITLECLPSLEAATFDDVQTCAALLVDEFIADGLAFTASSKGDRESNNVRALGTLNIQTVLPPAVNFIGRDIAKALPRDDAARVLRQFVNGAQMALHQSPVQGCAVNSLWCGIALPDDALSQTWLQGGLTAWWDALPAWDSGLDLAALGLANCLELVYSDTTIVVLLKRRSAWIPWTKPLQLAKVLQQAALVAN
jgi:hypothetical protein